MRRGRADTFASILQRRLRRRGFLRSAGVAAATLAVGSALPPLAACQPTPRLRAPGIWFDPIAPQPVAHDEIVVARGHTAEVLLRWGDPVLAGASPFDPANLTADSQARQFGYNCDYLDFFPLPWGSASSDRGLLWANHEYTNPELMFDRYQAGSPTADQVACQLAALGGSLVEVERSGRRLVVKPGSSLNRRVTATTPIGISGPAAGHDWLKTSADPTGSTVLGMLYNCAGGSTPWGTLLTCEEHFNQFFGNAGRLPGADPRSRVHARYGLPRGASARLWERHQPRFDVAREPNEPFRFGWVVELDPYDPTSVPVKRTALGRFKHEGASFAISPGGRVAFYSGHDEMFEYVYKFVSARPYSPTDRTANARLLDEGVLYVARFEDDGTGQWRPLVFGQEPLTPASGFASQADVLVKTVLAADAVGATRMDRPEDIQQNRVNKKVYLVCTNNPARGGDGRPPTDGPNPRPANQYGHIIELTEENDDPASTAFRWEIFLLCGDPGQGSTYFAGYARHDVSPISSPDNINFDLDGNLWVATDGQPTTLNAADAVLVVPTDGPERGRAQPFLSAVAGAECSGLAFTPDNRNLFVSIQHPGEGRAYDGSPGWWPDRTGPPRPAVVQVWADNGNPVGSTGK